MATKKNVCVKANEVMKATASDRKVFNQAYYSLSRLLRDTQTKTALKITAPIFKAIGLPVTGKVSANDVKELLAPEQYETVTKKGETTKYIVLWSHVQKTEKDKAGNIKKCFEADGVTPIMIDKSTRITEGNWTLNKLVKLMAQRNAFEAE